MPSVSCHTSIKYAPTSARVGPDSTGIWVATAEEVMELGELTSLPVTGTMGVAKLEVDLDENDPKLAKLFEVIWERHRLKPYEHSVIPIEDRRLYFGVKRTVAWSKKEIERSDLLWLSSTRSMANHATRTAEQLAREEYFVKNDSALRSKVQFGYLMPFTGLVMTEQLASQLRGENLVGIHLPEVCCEGGEAMVKPLHALRSDVVLPRALNLLQGEDGHAVEPNTEWWCWWDDGGRDPRVLRYDKPAIAALGFFDIAMTYERVGHTEQGAYRQCIVSQRFREVLQKLGIKGTDYSPVELV